MFENNKLTFNPGWDSSANKLDQFDDVRDIQKHVKSKGISLDIEVDKTTQSPAIFVMIDPDGNAILIDQYV
jgi:hypothetical protein